MKVEKNIRQLRELNNFTQSYMAGKLNMSTASYSKLEGGQTDITLSKIEQIAKILNVELENILNFDSNQIFNFHQDQKASTAPTGYAYKPKNFSDLGFKELVEHLKSENDFLRSLLQSKK